VRLFIDKPGGVTHDDCSRVSHQLSTVLDVEDFIHSTYVLEVSSPGLERGLYQRADYERFAGSQAKSKRAHPSWPAQLSWPYPWCYGRQSDCRRPNQWPSGNSVGRHSQSNLEADVESELRLGARPESISI